MIRFTLLCSILVIAVLIPALAFAADPARFDRENPQTFDDLFRQATKTNQSYRSSWEEQVIAKYTLMKAWGDFIPSASTRANFSNSHSSSPNALGIVGSDNSSSSSYSASLSLPIWDGGARYGVLNNARIGAKSAPLILTQAEWQLAYSLHAALNAAVAATEMVKTARSSVSLKQELLRLADAKYRLGATTEIDVLSTQVQLNNAQTSLLQAVQDSILSRVKLNQVIGVAANSTYPLAEIEDRTYVIPEIESIVSEAKQHSPQGILANYELERSKNDYRIANAAWYPQVDLSQSFNWSNSADEANKWTTATQNKSQTLGLSVSLPIFTGFQRVATTQTAKIAKKTSVLDHQSKMLQIDESVRDYYYRLVRAKEQITSAQSNVELARRQRELEQERYRVGSSTLLNVQNAQDAELTSQVQLINSRLNERTTKALLESTIGRALQ